MKRTIVFYLIVLSRIFSCHFKRHGDENLAGNEFSSKYIGCYKEDSSTDKMKLFITSPAKDSVIISLWTGTDNGIVIDTVVSDSGLTTFQRKFVSASDDISCLFTFYFDPNDMDRIKLECDNTTDGSTVVKSYVLQRKKFIYSTAMGTYPQASQRPLVDSDVNNAYKGDLERMRNEIFARHGYCFKDEGWRSNFEYTDWYIPYSTDVQKDLTDIEKKNITLIKKYEKTAKDEDFGRQ